MRREFIVLLSLASASCTIDRVVPIERFACEKGGPCNNADAGANDAQESPDVPILDDAGGFPDAAPPADAMPMDASLPAMSCASAVPISSTGLEVGLLDIEENDHNGVCNTEAGGLDKVLYFYSPGRIESFTASTQ